MAKMDPRSITYSSMTYYCWRLRPREPCEALRASGGLALVSLRA